MAGLPYGAIRETLGLLSSGGAQHGYSTGVRIDSDDTWLGTWATDQLYVIVLASVAAPDPSRTLIDVHAGGAYGASPEAGLFEALCTATWRFDFGGPWARRLPDGSATYGWRSRLPSELFAEANRGDAFGFVLGMIDAFGAAAGTLADELIPQFGGAYVRESDPNAWGPLIAGVIPPPGN